MLLSSGRFLGSADQHGREQEDNERRRQIDDACHGRTVRQLELGPGRRGILRWNVDAEIMQQRDNIARPADGDGGGAHGVFEDEVPTDDPGEDLAQGRIGIGVGAAGDRQKRGEFGVAQADEGTGDAADDEGEHDTGAGIVRRRRAGENEDTGADDAADAERRNAQRPKRLAKRVLTRFVDDGGYRLSGHQTLVCHGDIPFDCGQCSLPIRMRALGCGIWMIVSTRQEGKCVFGMRAASDNHGEILTVHAQRV